MCHDMTFETIESDCYERHTTEYDKIGKKYTTHLYLRSDLF